MAKSAQQGGKLNVFISYSRDDVAFVDQLGAALRIADFETTVDRQGISPADDWKTRLGALIRDADTIVFVLSPSSAESDICAWEVDQAVQLGKRIVPVICRSLERAKPPQRLAELNYIFFYPEPKSPGSGWGTGLAALASALNTDLDWLREHTRYLRLAKEWEEVGKPSDRRLLSAADIGLARKWVADRPKEAPAPTALQLDFIEASKTEDNRRQSAEVQRQKREAEQAKRVARRTLMGLAAAVILALAASGFAFVAYQQRQTALLVTATAKSERNKAEEQRRLAEQASDTAKKERDKAQKATQEADAAREETQRQLDRANQALAQSIKSDLGLKPNEPLDPRQRQALWRLTLADEAIKSDFISILAKSPEETVRVSPGFAQILRTLGLLRPSAAEAESLLEPELKQIGQTTDANALRTLAQALKALAPKS